QTGRQPADLAQRTSAAMIDFAVDLPRPVRRLAAPGHDSDQFTLFQPDERLHISIVLADTPPGLSGGTAPRTPSDVSRAFDRPGGLSHRYKSFRINSLRPSSAGVVPLCYSGIGAVHPVFCRAVSFGKITCLRSS